MEEIRGIKKINRVLKKKYIKLKANTRISNGKRKVERRNEQPTNEKRKKANMKNNVIIVHTEA